MNKYRNQTRLLAAVDCVIFGFDGQSLQLLLVQRGIDPDRGKWSLMGGFIQADETADEAAQRVLLDRTGLRGVYLEQFYSFTRPDRDPMERTISIAYFSLIDIKQYQQPLSDEFHAGWFPLNKVPKLIFDHDEILKMAKQKLRHKAAVHPILFELLPEKFTLPQLQSLFESVYENQFDKRNFNRKILSTELVIRLTEKDMSASRKGAFFHKLNTKHYRARFQDFMNLIPASQRR